ncbi:MAG: site-2 protease family protein [Cyanobacteria bacterium P01_A01_bin.3]
MTNVPWLKLWVVMMMPIFVLVVSVQVFQRQPNILVLGGLFLFSYISSLSMLRRGRLRVPAQRDKSSDGSDRDGSAEGEVTDSTGNSSDRDASSAATTPAEVVARQLKSIGTPTNKALAELSRDKLRGCFPWTMYYIQDFEYRPQAIICRGNLRAAPDEAYQCISDNLRDLFGQRFLLVLQEGFSGKPFFAIVPNPTAAAQEALEGDTDTEVDNDRERPNLALALLVASLFSAMSVGALASGDITPETLFSPPTNLLVGLPYALALVLILGAHELGHYVAARRHNLNMSLPYFIPVPFFLGTFGAFVRLKEPVPDRKSLFDVSIAGPLAGLAVAFPLLIVGLMQSTVVPFPDPVSEPTSQLFLESFTFDPSQSILLAILAKLALGSELSADTVLQFHPIGFASWLGLLVISLNLIPIGQLGGGHIVHAMYGHQMGTNIGKVTRVLVVLLAFTLQPWLRAWMLVVLLLTSTDEPALNDVTDLDERRDLLGLFTLTVLTVVILPLPPPLQILMGLA